MPLNHRSHNTTSEVPINSQHIKEPKELSIHSFVALSIYPSVPSFTSKEFFEAYRAFVGTVLGARMHDVASPLARYLNCAL